MKLATSGILFIMILSQSTAAADVPTIVSVESAFTVPCPVNMVIRDFTLTSDGVLVLISGLTESRTYSDQLLLTTYSGELRRKLELPYFKGTYGRLAVSKSGQVAVLRRIVGNMANLLLIDPISGASRVINADQAGEQKPVEIEFLDENTLLAGAYDGLYSISLPSGVIETLTNGQRVDFMPPFAILRNSKQVTHTIDFTPGLFRTIVHGQGVASSIQIQSPEIAEIPAERIDGGAAILYSADVTPTSRIFCAVSGTRHEEGGRVIELAENGTLKSRFILRLPLFADSVKSPNHKHGEMTPRLLRVSDTKIALSSMSGNKIVVYPLR